MNYKANVQNMRQRAHESIVYTAPPCRDPRGHVMSDSNICVVCGWVPRPLHAEDPGEPMAKKRKHPKSPTPAKVERLAVRDGGYFCWYCSYPLKAGLNLTTDHILATSKGGTNEDDNCCLSCPPCNRKKSDGDVDEFRATPWLIERQRYVGRLRWLEIQMENKKGNEDAEVEPCVDSSLGG